MDLDMDGDGTNNHQGDGAVDAFPEDAFDTDTDGDETQTR